MKIIELLVHRKEKKGVIGVSIGWNGEKSYAELREFVFAFSIPFYERTRWLVITLMRLDSVVSRQSTRPHTTVHLSISSSIKISPLIVLQILLQIWTFFLRIYCFFRYVVFMHCSQFQYRLNKVKILFIYEGWASSLKRIDHSKFWQQFLSWNEWMHLFVI